MLSENKQAWEQNGREIRVHALTTVCEWRNNCVPFGLNYNPFAHPKQPQRCRTVIVQAGRKQCILEVKSWKMTAKNCGTHKNVGIFSHKINTLFWVQFRYLSSRPAPQYNLQLAVNQKRIENRWNDWYKISIWSWASVPPNFFLVPPKLGWEKTARILTHLNPFAQWSSSFNS